MGTSYIRNAHVYNVVAPHTYTQTAGTIQTPCLVITTESYTSYVGDSEAISVCIEATHRHSNRSFLGEYTTTHERVPRHGRRQAAERVNNNNNRV